jgi:hypothetical protein
MDSIAGKEAVLVGVKKSSKKRGIHPEALETRERIRPSCVDPDRESRNMRNSPYGTRNSSSNLLVGSSLQSSTL